MKKLILLLGIIISTTLLNAQGNLQFNQVLTFTSGSNYTVPSGKVLKITSINFGNSIVCVPKSSTVTKNCGSYSSDYGIYNSISYLTIDNINFTTPTFHGGPSSSYSCHGIVNTPCNNYDFGEKTFLFPIWLQAGKIVAVNSGVSQILITAIEFNVIP